MGSVYEAVDPKTSQHVAIKMLRADYTSEPSLAARFEREIAVMSALNHPHIVPFLGYGEHDNKTYFVMTLIQGPSLGTWLDSHFFSPLDAQFVLYAVCSALDYAHALSVIHRDVKPSNILLDMSNYEPVVYLSDFGLSKVATMISLTETRMQIGTPDYMSPEQAEDLPLSPATDVYALSVITYELLLRELPFNAMNELEMVTAHVNWPPRPPSQLVESFPPGLEAVLLTGLEKDPAERYQSAGEFYEAFSSALAELSEEEQQAIYRYF